MTSGDTSSSKSPFRAKQQSSQHLEFRCLFDERAADTPLYRTLKAALLYVSDYKTRAVRFETPHFDSPFLSAGVL